MKTHVLRTSIVALLAAVAAHAQSSLPLRANIPFNFVAGNVTFNAGHYTVFQEKAGLIAVRSADRKANAYLLTGAVQSAGVQRASRMVFHRYGSTYILAEIWTSGDNRGRLAVVTRRERELAAKNKTPDDNIVIAATE